MSDILDLQRQAHRLLRADWRTATSLAEELYAILAALPEPPPGGGGVSALSVESDRRRQDALSEFRRLDRDSPPTFELNRRAREAKEDASFPPTFSVPPTPPTPTFSLPAVAPSVGGVQSRRRDTSLSFTSEFAPPDLSISFPSPAPPPFPASPSFPASAAAPAALGSPPNPSFSQYSRPSVPDPPGPALPPPAPAWQPDLYRFQDAALGATLDDIGDQPSDEAARPQARFAPVRVPGAPITLAELPAHIRDDRHAITDPGSPAQYGAYSGREVPVNKDPLSDSPITRDDPGTLEPTRDEDAFRQTYYDLRFPQSDFDSARPVGGGGITTYMGQVKDKADQPKQFNVYLYRDGPDGEPDDDTVVVRIPQFDDKDDIPEGTWLTGIYFFAVGDETRYYCQPPVWVDSHKEEDEQS